MNEELKEKVISFLATVLRGVRCDDDYKYGYECPYCYGFQHMYSSAVIVHDDDCEAMLLYKELTKED